MRVAGATGRTDFGRDVVSDPVSPLAAERIGTRLDLYEGAFMVSGTVHYPGGLTVHEWFGPKFDDKREAHARIDARRGLLPDDVHVGWFESYVPSDPDAAPRSGIDLPEQRESLALADRVTLYRYARELMAEGAST